MSKYYQDNKIRLQKSLIKGIKVFLKKKNEKKQQYGCKRYKNLSEDENKSWLSIEKHKLRKKHLVVIIRNTKVGLSEWVM